MARSRSRLDVICIGETLWDLVATGGAPLESAASFRRVPGGAAVNVAMALCRRGLSAGLCAGVGDDPMGRGLCERVAEEGVDVRHVRSGTERTGIVFVERARTGQPDGAREAGKGAPGRFPRVVNYRRPEDESVALARAIPDRFEARGVHVGSIIPSRSMVRLLSGVMRQARRDGCLVTLDINARPRLWANARRASHWAVVGEADVVKCSALDLAVMGIGPEAMASHLRPSATLVITNGAAAARAVGPFGEVVRAPRARRGGGALGAGDAFCAGVIAAILGAGRGHSLDRAQWHEALGEGHREAGQRMTTWQKR
jgi:sugar/nucleoside kinase (ribokinase family)